MTTDARRGFTLIELLVVISILSILSGLLLPMVSMASKRAKEANTLALLRKVDVGLELFKGEVDTYPYQAHDVATSFPESTNRLAWILAHDLDATEHAALRADLDRARAAYLPGGGAHVVTEGEVDARQEIRDRAGWMTGMDIEARGTTAGMVNRLAAERASLAVLAGNADVLGIHRDRNRAILQGASSEGYAFDFLSIDLNPDDIAGDAIIDSYGRPLLYNCPVVQGVRAFFPSTALSHKYDKATARKIPMIDPAYYGMETVGRTVTTDKHSDQRTTAAAAFATRYELWSAGDDGLIDPIRSAAVNQDNIAAGSYLEGLR